MTEDVVAELDRAIADPFGWHTAIMQRARDEIVALREMVERQRYVLSKGHAETRAAALEEAAEVVEEHVDRDHRDNEDRELMRGCCEVMAADIRALKEKGDG